MKKSNASKLSPRKTLPELDALLREFEIPYWDYCLIGDGSGLKWKDAAGWATYIIRREPAGLVKLTGSVSHGTNNFAELMAYMHPLDFLLGKIEESRDGNSYRLETVHIFTDSDYCVRGGTAADRRRKTHGPLWAGIDAIARQGLRLFWHLIPRNSNSFHLACDTLSKRARKHHQSLSHDT